MVILGDRREHFVKGCGANQNKTFMFKSIFKFLVWVKICYWLVKLESVIHDKLCFRFSVSFDQCQFFQQWLDLRNSRFCMATNEILHRWHSHVETQPCKPKKWLSDFFIIYDAYIQREIITYLQWFNVREFDQRVAMQYYLEKPSVLTCINLPKSNIWTTLCIKEWK